MLRVVVCALRLIRVIVGVSWVWKVAEVEVALEECFAVVAECVDASADAVYEADVEEHADSDLDGFSVVVEWGVVAY